MGRGGGTEEGGPEAGELYSVYVPLWARLAKGAQLPVWIWRAKPSKLKRTPSQIQREKQQTLPLARRLLCCAGARTRSDVVAVSHHPPRRCPPPRARRRCPRRCWAALPRPRARASGHCETSGDRRRGLSRRGRRSARCMRRLTTSTSRPSETGRRPPSRGRVQSGHGGRLRALSAPRNRKRSTDAFCFWRVAGNCLRVPAATEATGPPRSAHASAPGPAIVLVAGLRRHAVLAPRPDWLPAVAASSCAPPASYAEQGHATARPSSPRVRRDAVTKPSRCLHRCVPCPDTNGAPARGICNREPRSAVCADHRRNMLLMMPA